MSLPSTLTLTGLNAKAGMAYYPASLVLNKVVTKEGIKYISDSIPMKIGGVSRTVYGRVAEATVSNRETAKGETLNGLIRVVLPVQINESAATLEEADDMRLTVPISPIRNVNMDTTSMSDATKAVLAAVAVTGGLVEKLAVGDLV